jgi:hypothetical protein
MAARALEVLTDDALLAKMSQRARATAKARFCSTKIIPQYEALYRGLLEGKA